MKQETKDALFSAWDWCDENDKSTEFMLQFMADSAKVEYDRAVQFVSDTSWEERVKWRETYQSTRPDISETFTGFNHGTGKIVIDGLDAEEIYEMRPTQIHLKEDGAIDDKPSLAILFMDTNGNTVVGQISLDMFNKGVKDIGYQLIKV